MTRSFMPRDNVEAFAPAAFQISGNRARGSRSTRPRVVLLRTEGMRTFLCFVVILTLSVGATLAASEQQVVDETAQMIREFRSMPERGIPESVLRHARGLAIVRVVKVG